MKQERTFYIIREEKGGQFFACVDVTKSEKLRIKYTNEIRRETTRWDSADQARRGYEDLIAECQFKEHEFTVCTVHATYIIDEKGPKFTALPKSERAHPV